MRNALLTLMLVFASTTASAAALSAKDRASAADSYDRSCQKVYFALAMQEAAKGGEAIPAVLQSASTIPLDDVRKALKGEPLERQIVSTCDCAMASWKKNALAAPTKAALDANTALVAKYPATAADTAHVHACMDKARVARGLPPAANAVSK